MIDQGILIGLRDLHYAILTTDDSTNGATYETPVRLSNAINAKISPKQSVETLYANDGPFVTVDSLEEISVELEISDLSLETQAALLGHSIANGVVTKKSSDIAPEVALGFRSIKSNGKYRYVWLLKGKFHLPEDDFATKADKVSFNTPKIKGTFIKRHDDAWQYMADEDSTDYVATIGTEWFAAVYEPTVGIGD